jgi:hypothetical protein
MVPPLKGVAFLGGESEMTPWQSTSKSQQNTPLEICNKKSNPDSQLKYNLTAHGF